MKYRPLDSNGDYTVGIAFLSDSPATVAQAVLTRLKLWQGEWFLDSTAGTPWTQSILGRSTNPDAFIRAAILGTTGVTALQSYSSTYTPGSRSFDVSGTVATLYGPAVFNTTITVP